jgi:glycosyltransferase involved in cell wall biosynthesis
MRKRSPEVSVVLPVHNCQSFIGEAIESILSQSLVDLELIIIDDGSTDKSSEIILSYTDNRIVVLRNEARLGISRALNRGIALCAGIYVARMDADDIALPERMARQVRELNSNLGADICYSAFAQIDANGLDSFAPEISASPLPTEWMLLWTNPIAHPTVMFRRAAVERLSICYDPEYEPAEDYELWARISLRGGFTYIRETLLKYRRLDTSAFNSNPKKSFLRGMLANENLIRRIKGVNAPPFHKYMTIFGGAIEDEMMDVEVSKLENWYRDLAEIHEKCLNWPREVMRLVSKDIEKRVESALREKRQIYYANGTRKRLLLNKPLLLFKLEVAWGKRRVRSLAKIILRP